MQMTFKETVPRLSENYYNKFFTLSLGEMSRIYWYDFTWTAAVVLYTTNVNIQIFFCVCWKEKLLHAADNAVKMWEAY